MNGSEKKTRLSEVRVSERSFGLCVSNNYFDTRQDLQEKTHPAGSYAITKQEGSVWEKCGSVFMSHIYLEIHHAIYLGVGERETDTNQQGRD